MSWSTNRNVSNTMLKRRDVVDSSISINLACDEAHVHAGATDLRKNLKAILCRKDTRSRQGLLTLHTGRQIRSSMWIYCLCVGILTVSAIAPIYWHMSSISFTGFVALLDCKILIRSLSTDMPHHV